MHFIQIVWALLFLFLGLSGGYSTLNAQDSTSIDPIFQAPAIPQGFEKRQQVLSAQVAENRSIAVEKLRSSSYVVILMEVQIPAMNGYDATNALRALSNAKARTPIMAMTGNELKDEVDICYQAGISDFIGATS